MTVLTCLSLPAERHLASLVSCLILFMAVMAWCHLCHLLLARIPLIQSVWRLWSTSTYTLLSVIQGWDRQSPAVSRS